MRKVEILKKEYNPETKKMEYVEPKKTATFHQFGIDFEELDHGTGQFTTAVVEHKNGMVQNLPLDMIRFVDND